MLFIHCYFFILMYMYLYIYIYIYIFFFLNTHKKLIGELILSINISSCLSMYSFSSHFTVQLQRKLKATSPQAILHFDYFRIFKHS